ncbi:type I methionyl aminopeptidase [Corallococcus sp. H22C18031201]|uniref:type I methionyl aminopeptidase n=1 Tax=Citreicoccus inhibens TaxID=2849499 RepID=UPI000E73F850|nr:type I methionyl aminopeptidase [Citreicoccus inhibens]MBU8896842.1 type I methionyl aminopeptidase [Citreicoccus inhibens]RJS21866.1 type I methionyl aminopeptidase [Corallococcus sp. H22C18031201]
MTVTTPPAVLPGPNEPCWCGSGSKYKKCHRGADSVEARKRGPEPVRAGSVRPGIISPRRSVPANIPRPDYAESGKPRRSRFAESDVKSPEVLARMRRACRAAGQVLQEAASHLRPGITTDEIDAITHAAYIQRGGYPSTLNYHGYPKSLCTSVNEVICHGIPDSRALEDGDIVNLDITIFLEGVHGDCSATYFVGKVDPESERLVRVTRECLDLGIGAVKVGRPISDIGRAIEGHATKNGMSVVRAYCGHGIGETFHTSLQIPHYYEAEADTVIEPGMVFTIEPMINLGDWHHRSWDDGWTAVTADGKRSAQFEHTILVTEQGAEILTLP